MPPRLTSSQKKVLHIWEPALKDAVRRGDFDTAKAATKHIQDILRPTGHEARLMKSKNRLFEAAMEAGKLNLAINGFVGNRRKVARRTRVYLEATTLLAICYLRLNDLKSAKPLMAEAIKSARRNIQSERQRALFWRKLISRFEGESLIATLSGTGSDVLVASEIHREAGLLVQRKNEDEIMGLLGQSVPVLASGVMEEVQAHALKQLAPREQKLLPSPVSSDKKVETGNKLFTTFGRFLWKSLCDDRSIFRKRVIEEGIGGLLGGEFISENVCNMLNERKIGITIIAVVLSALIIRMGVDTICKNYTPLPIMD